MIKPFQMRLLMLQHEGLIRYAKTDRQIDSWIEKTAYEGRRYLVCFKDVVANPGRCADPALETQIR